MPKLCQIIAIENGTKTSTEKELTETYHVLQKPAMMIGISRSYKPKDEEGDKLPDENQNVQTTAIQLLQKTASILTKLFDVTATKDFANCDAKADVTVDGVTIIKACPVTHLLFLEKRLVDIDTLIKTIPTLDPSERWKFDAGQNCFVAEPSETTKTKKVMKNHVKAKATDKHPEQVDVFTEDVVIGTWKTIKYSGALPAKTVADIRDRVAKLRTAVKFAREEANSITINNQQVGGAFFDYLLAPLANAS